MNLITHNFLGSHVLFVVQLYHNEYLPQIFMGIEIPFIVVCFGRVLFMQGIPNRYF